MRRLVLAALCVGALVVACSGDTDESASGESDGGSNDATTGSDAKTTDSSSGTDAHADTSTGKDSSTPDTSVADTSTADTSVADTSIADTSSPDVVVESGIDAGLDAAPDVVFNPDGAPGDGGCVAPADAGACTLVAGNFASCATATASSTYPSYDAVRAIDGDMTTSWYAETSTCSCTSGPEPCTCAGNAAMVNVSLNTLRTVGRVKIFGNRDGFDTYDVVTARIQLLDAVGTLLHSADVTANANDAGSDGDINHVVSPAIGCVKTIRVIVLTAEASGPGIGEIQAFAN